MNRKKPLLEKEIKIDKFKATVKFYEGDSIEDHLQKLQKLFGLKFDQKCKLEKELQKAFGKLTTESVVQKRSQIQNEKAEEIEEYDPLIDKDDVQITD